MVLSMTGYGSDIINTKDINIDIEVKSLNSKYFDFNYRSNYDNKLLENEIRNFIKSKLIRGKVDVKINFNQSNLLDSNELNKKKIKAYFNEIKEVLSGSNEINDKEILKNILNNLSLFTSEKKIHISNRIIMRGIRNSINRCIIFRKEEGVSIHNDLKKKIDLISQELTKIIRIDKNKKNNLTKKIKNSVSKLKNISIDEYRIEQEILFYLERLDINEEVLRLKNHISLFKKTLSSKKPIGKKLNFISQEIGREINTIGSKCSNFQIQKSVINMKEYLEKIKEENYNVL
tara:strand:- start:13976 stop:14842 length:867 start_codon:yes stop_codon:yes gene_type:complete